MKKRNHLDCDVSSTPTVNPSPTPVRPGISAFTLVELLAVMVVILVVVGLTLKVGGYVQRKSSSQQVRATIKALEMALEMYKNDQGDYPASSSMRVSMNGNVEAQNSAALYRALMGGPKKYISLPAKQLQQAPITSLFQTTSPYPTNVVLPLMTGSITNFIIIDPWGRPINYYHTKPVQPTTTATNSIPENPIASPLLNAVVGGQVNLTSYDLMSYGPDMSTYEPKLSFQFASPAAANDDITNFRR